MPRVGIRKTDLDSLEESVEALLELISYRPVRDRILLKPNIVTASAPENGDVTHPEVTGALIRYFQKRGRKVVVAEGTGIFSSEKEFERLLHATRYDRLTDRMGVPIINLERAEREKISWRYGTIALPKMLAEYEYVNVPTMKTHIQTTVTLGVKNQKGLISMRTKKVFHKKALHEYIQALAEVVQPTLTVVDGLYCIEGTGPTGPPVGEVKRMDLLVAGKDMMTVDNVCTRIMGINVKEARHLLPVKNIRVLGEKIKDVRSPFKRPRAFISVKPFTVYSDDRVCTMCSVPFHKALSKIFYTPALLEQLEKRGDLRRIEVIMGPSDPPADLGPCVVCLGDCAVKTARRKGLPIIRGCHPDYREIVNFLFPGTYPKIAKTDVRNQRDRHY